MTDWLGKCGTADGTSFRGGFFDSLKKTPWLALCLGFLLLAFLIIDPQSSFWKFGVVDPDDAMRLTQVLDFIKGQDWYDVQQHRLIDGESRWSRLADLPLAGFSFLFRGALNVQDSVIAASLILPLFLLGLGLMPLLCGMTRLLSQKKQPHLALGFLLFSPHVIFQFIPARVDHHAYQLLIAGGSFMILMRLLTHPVWRKGAVLAGLIQAAGLWIGAEAFPFVAIFAFILGCAAAWKGQESLKTAALYGVSLFGFTALMLPLARPLTEMGLREVTWFSLAYVIFASLVGALFVALYLVGRKASHRGRFLALGGFGLCAAGLFFWAVPLALLGPYANMDSLGQELILNSVTEAQPLVRKMAFSGFGWALFFHSCLIPLLLVLFSLFKTITSLGRRRWIFGAAFFYLAISFGAAFFWQARVMTFVQLFAIPVACAAFVEACKILRTKCEGRVLFASEVFVFCALSILPSMIAPALLTQEQKTLGGFFKPVRRPVAMMTVHDPVWGILNDPQGLGASPKRILAPMYLGPDLLFFTPHYVFAAPYHAPHNQHVFDVLKAQDMDKAWDLVQSLKVDAILIPRKISAAYAGLASREAIIGTALKTGPNGKLYLETDEKNLSLLERFIRNKPPRWLKIIEISGEKDYVLGIIQPPIPKKKEEHHDT